VKVTKRGSFKAVLQAKRAQRCYRISSQCPKTRPHLATKLKLKEGTWASAGKFLGGFWSKAFGPAHWNQCFLDIVLAGW
jgi:hypothetical protein